MKIPLPNASPHLLLCLILLPVCVRAQEARAQDVRPQDSLGAVGPQDSVRVIEQGARLRVWTGRAETTTLIGRLERADSQAVRIVVSGEEGDPRIKFALLGVETAGDALGDSAIAAIPWRLVRNIDVASGRRSRRVANSVYGALIGAAMGGGAGAVFGALQARSTCTSSGSASCGITPSAGVGMAMGALVGGAAGGVYGGWRESWVTLWTTLPDRGRQLRGGAGRPR